MPQPTDQRSDEELIQALNLGDADAFAPLYYRHRDWVVRLAYRFTRNEQDALDVLQETFMYLAGKFPGFQLTASMTTFLYRAVKSNALALQRKRLHMATEQDLAPLADPGDCDGHGDVRAELASMMALLSTGEREIVLMRFVDGMSPQEIASALDVPLGTIKSRLSRALGRLRDDTRTRDYLEA